jgi:hypothetical protein
MPTSNLVDNGRLDPMWPFIRTREAIATIEVEPPRRDGHRVTARIDGRAVSFSSRDIDLAPAPEAFGSAFLVSAMHAGRSLRLQAPVCDIWAGHLAPLTAAFAGLWYADAPPPLVTPIAHAGAGSTSTALCFSGGVDAFHTLLQGGVPVHRLVYVVGYDVKLRERQRAEAVAHLVRDVASSLGIRSAIITTDLRRHPLHKSTPWLRTFGGALAAIGHLLGAEAGRLLTSSDGLGHAHPEVGSRPDTDPLHGSRQMVIEHVAGSVTRLEKIRAIAAEPLVQRHLRVCWKNVGQSLNCGRCEKCVRTMVALDACGALGRFAGFSRGRGLLAAIDGLPAIEELLVPFYEESLRQGLSGPVAGAARRLLDRSRSTFSTANASAIRKPRSPTPRRRLLQADDFAHVFDPLVGQRVGYVRPIGNVGDDLIELSMMQLFAEYGTKWSLWQPNGSTIHDVLVFGGGGNMGTRYMNNHSLRGEALASGLPLVILPQSFSTPEDRGFARVYVRERESLKMHPTGILAPDLALSLRWPEPPRPTRELGVFLRRDRERVGRKPLLARDPVRLCTTPAAYLALAADHRRIVTDRLHFAVAGLHAGRDVTLVANAYHKNRSMHETWLARLGCRFADDARQALAASRRAA